MFQNRDPLIKLLSEEFNELAKILDKVYQTHRIYDSIWKERVKIYSNIIVPLKKGRGFLWKSYPDVSKDFSNEIDRLSTLNKREVKVLQALLENKDVTISLIKNKIDLAIKNSPAEGKEFLNLINRLYSFADIVDYYFKMFFKYQMVVLRAVRDFITNPQIETLSKVYKIINRVGKKVNKIVKLYDKASAPFTDLINIQNSINNLFESVNKGITIIEKAAMQEKEKTYLLSVLNKVKKTLHPYFDKKNKQLYGTFPQRMSLNTTDFPRIVTSIAVRMALITPLLDVLVSAGLNYPPGTHPSVSINLFEAFGRRFYLDFYLASLSYLAYVLDVIPGVAQLIIATPSYLSRTIKAELGYEDPFT